MTTFIQIPLIIWLLTAGISISGCVKPPTTLPIDPSIARITDPKARRQLQRGNPQAAADIYSARARKTNDPETHQDYLLVAAEILFDRAMLEAGLNKLASVPEELISLELQQRRRILIAKSHLYSSDPEQALATLPDPAEIESPLHKARVFETRAQSYRALQNPDNELIARIDLENQLVDVQIVDKSHIQIWQLLTIQPLSTLRSLTTNVRGDTYQGWIELALVNAESGTNAQQRRDNLKQWQTRFSEHPANARFIANLYAPGQFDPISVDGLQISQIAVLLPLSSSATETVSAAIRDGIIAAYQSASDQQNNPTLRFYDVGENPAYVRTAYQNAIADGADAVIGPLRKQAVAAIVTQRRVPVPTITLNTVDTFGSGTASNVIQFGLAPEDEARSAASRAIALSLNNAIILQADDSRGDREARAFQDELYRYGGDVVHIEVLAKDQYDYSEQIRNALLITQSDQRFHTLSSNIGKRLFFEPAIRNDVDVIFLAVTSEQARSVRPQLDFFHASSVPRFATSRIASFEKDPRKNKDLNSIFYADAPWVLRSSLKKDPLRRSVLASFTNAEGVYAKLYALGIDAYNLITHLDALTNGEQHEGYTGDLELAIDGTIHRHLDWAQYQEGASVSVKRIEAEPLQTIRSGALN